MRIPAEMTDREVLERLTKADHAMYDNATNELAEELAAMEAEIERRFGDGANDVLASYWTASHAGSEDRVRQAEEDSQTLVEIAAGTHVHLSNGPACKCGVLAQFIK